MNYNGSRAARLYSYGLLCCVVIIGYNNDEWLTHVSHYDSRQVYKAMYTHRRLQNTNIVPTVSLHTQEAGKARLIIVQ